MKHTYPAAWPLLVLSLLSGGCAIDTTPDASVGLRPALTDGSVRSNESLAQEYRAHIDAEWWTVYGDSRLNSLVEQALANNLDLKQAALNVNKALYQANILGADLVPSFNASLGAAQSRNLANGTNTPRSYSSQLGLSYELDLWRRLNAAASAQIWEHRATEEDLAATRLTVANNTVDAYFQIAYLNQSVRLAEQSVGQYREILRIAESKHRHGRASSAEPLQARQALLSAQNQLRDLQENRAAALSTLRQLLNSRPDAQTDWVPEHFRLPEGHPAPDLDIPVAALANRPDLLAAEARLQSAAKSQIAQYRSWYPRITLGATVGTSAETAAKLFEVPILGGNIGISLPFLNWPTLRWQDRTAEAGFEQAKLGFEKALLTGLHETDTHYRQYRHSSAALTHAREAHRLAQESSRYHSARYRHGRSELADWLNALNSEYGSAQSLLNARYTVLRHEGMIYKAIAGRYRRDPAQAPAVE